MLMLRSFSTIAIEAFSEFLLLFLRVFEPASHTGNEIAVSKIENLTAELCDELMKEAASGHLGHIRKSISMLLEYSSYEVARHGDSVAAAALLRTAKYFEECF